LKILVTGAAGFIGYHLISQLLNRGDRVVGLDSINDYYDINLKYSRLSNHGITKEKIESNKLMQSETDANYSFVKMSLEDKDAVLDLFKQEQFDYVCNLAAQAGVRYSLINPHAYINSNIVGFLNILEGSRHNKVKHVVYASSSSVYGLNESMPFSTSDNIDHPVSLYAASKKSNELMAHSYSHLYNLPTSGLRFFTVYGPWGRPDMALFLFTEAILNNKPIKIFNNGEMQRDFTYVDDIVNGVVRVIDHVASPNKNWSGKSPDPSSSKAPYKVYNIGNSNPVNLMDFVRAIEKAIGKEGEKEYLPMQPGDVKATYADVTDLVESIDYKPNTTIEYGIAEFINWYRQYYQVG